MGEGDEFAARFSVAPLVPAASARPPLEEEAAFAAFASSYALFHAEGGVVPLVGAKKNRAMATTTTTNSVAAASQLCCPYLHHAAAAPARADATISSSESKEAALLKVPARSEAAQAGQGAARERGSSPQASPLSRLPSPSSSELLPAASAPFASISLRLFGGGMVSCVFSSNA